MADGKRRLESLSFMMAADSVIIILSAQSDIGTYLPLLLTKSSSTKNLNLVVACKSKIDTIAAIEEWAYGDKGVYSKFLNLSLFERKDEPDAEIFGGFIDGKLIAYINQEGYIDFSLKENQALMLEAEQLPNEQPVWSLTRSPEARIIERLRRELKEEKGFPVEALDFLVNEAAAYEDTKPTSKDQDVSPWEVLSNSLISKMKCHKNKVVADKADTVKDTLFGLRVLDL